ncbi:hypothetical protein C8Q76DRAFT_200808 [Earliella scabrosa]|nr:hypothetical protein C8Q76DRAFT_200808 [Earliella scabrosa]
MEAPGTVDCGMMSLCIAAWRVTIPLRGLVAWTSCLSSPLIVMAGKKRKTSASSDTETEVTAAGVKLKDTQTIDRGVRNNEITDALSKLQVDARTNQSPCPKHALTILLNRKQTLITRVDTGKTVEPELLGIVPDPQPGLPLFSYGIRQSRPDDDEVAEHAERYRAMMSSAFMSSDNFERLYHITERHVPVLVPEEYGRCMLINALLLRVAAMLEDIGHLCIYPNYTVPVPSTEPACPVLVTIDYLLVLLPKNMGAVADIFLEGGADEGLRRANGFAVVRATPSPSGFTNLGGALRKALLAVAALAKKYGLPIMSGAVTDGLEWQLFTFKVGPNGVGGTYQWSIPVDVDWSPATRAVLTGALKDLIQSASAVTRVPVQAHAVSTPPMQHD